MARGMSPNSFREMNSPYAEKEVIRKEKRIVNEVEIKKIVDKIDEDYIIYKNVEELLMKYEKSMLVPDTELEKISDEIGYSIPVIATLLKKIEKKEEERKNKMN